jgi:hypothetical protein
MIGMYLKNRSPDRFVFQKGSVITDALAKPVVQFKVSATELAHYGVLPNSAMIPLISETVSKLLLELCPSDIQLIETEVITSSGPVQGYKLLNAVHRVACIDHEHSEYTFIPGTDAIMGFKRFRAKSSCLGDHHIARETEYTSYLYVSSQVKEAFSSKDLRGYMFSTPEAIHS